MTKAANINTTTPVSWYIRLYNYLWSHKEQIPEDGNPEDS